MKYLFALTDDETRYWIAQEVAASISWDYFDTGREKE
jgi:hypothetical protein